MKKRFSAPLKTAPIRIEYVEYARLNRGETCKAGSAAAQKFGGEDEARNQYNKIMTAFQQQPDSKAHEGVIQALLKAQKTWVKCCPVDECQ
jgi:uncharacterized protein YecT (DUF1311 family)